MRDSMYELTTHLGRLHYKMNANSTKNISILIVQTLVQKM